MNPAEQWFGQAEYDLDTARAMLDSGRYLYVLFCCQQAAEKTIKGIIAERTAEFPPRTHSLVLLAGAAGMKPTEEQMQWLREVSNYYIQTRCPEEISSLAASVTRELAGQVLEQTQEALKWLRSTR